MINAQEPMGLGRKAEAKSEAVECFDSEHRDHGAPGGWRRNFFWWKINESRVALRTQRLTVHDVFFFLRYGKWFQHSIISGCGTMAFTLTKDGKMEIWVKVSEVKNQECRPRFLPRKLANQAQPIMVKKPRKRTGERNWRFGLQGSLVRFPTLSYSYWILV